MQNGSMCYMIKNQIEPFSIIKVISCNKLREHINRHVM